jgi:hypothetical protein
MMSELPIASAQCNGRRPWKTKLILAPKQGNQITGTQEVRMVDALTMLGPDI